MEPSSPGAWTTQAPVTWDKAGNVRPDATAMIGFHRYLRRLPLSPPPAYESWSPMRGSPRTSPR
ncbi:hypothetical protein ACFVY0_31470 [Streptomyces sp. NPDC058286]|uniref:hypothetical protein n=1 Tax=Streptomyces sp. NPDC058286 TaxID=3346422 RepID=UPI0036E730C1